MNQTQKMSKLRRLFCALILLIQTNSFGANYFTEQPANQRCGLEFEFGPDEFKFITGWFDFEYFKQQAFKKFASDKEIFEVFGGLDWDSAISDIASFEALPSELKQKLSAGIRREETPAIRILDSHGAPIDAAKTKKLQIPNNTIITNTNSQTSTTQNQLLTNPSIPANSSQLILPPTRDKSKKTEIEALEIRDQNGEVHTGESNFLRQLVERWSKLSPIEKIKGTNWNYLKAEQKSILTFLYINKKTFGLGRVKMNLNDILKPIAGTSELQSNQKLVLELFQNLDFEVDASSIEVKYKDKHMVSDANQLASDLITLASLSHNSRAITNPEADPNKGAYHYHLSRKENIPRELLELFQDNELLLRLNQGLVSAFFDKIYGYSTDLLHHRGLVAYGNGEENRLEVRAHIRPLIEELKFYLKFLNLPNDVAIQQLHTINKALFLKTFNFNILVEPKSRQIGFSLIKRYGLLSNPDFVKKLVEFGEIDIPLESRKTVFYKILWELDLQEKSELSPLVLRDVLTYPEQFRNFVGNKYYASKILKSEAKYNFLPDVKNRLHQHLFTKNKIYNTQLDEMIATMIYKDLNRSEKYELFEQLTKPFALTYSAFVGLRIKATSQKLDSLPVYFRKLLTEYLLDMDPLINKIGYRYLLNQAEVQLSLEQLSAFKQLLHFLISGDLKFFEKIDTHVLKIDNSNLKIFEILRALVKTEYNEVFGDSEFNRKWIKEVLIKSQTDLGERAKLKLLINLDVGLNHFGNLFFEFARYIGAESYHQDTRWVITLLQENIPQIYLGPLLATFTEEISSLNDHPDMTINKDFLKGCFFILVTGNYEPQIQDFIKLLTANVFSREELNILKTYAGNSNNKDIYTDLINKYIKTAPISEDLQTAELIGPIRCSELLIR